MTRGPDPDPDSKMQRTLRRLEKGPVTRGEVPAGPRKVMRGNGFPVRVFKTGTKIPPTKSGTGYVRGVYYLDEHDRREVVEKFLEANPRFVGGLEEYVAYKRLQEDTGDEWEPVIKSVWEERGWSKTHGNQQPGEPSGYDTCPLCEEPLPDAELPYHLPECPEA